MNIPEHLSDAAKRVLKDALNAYNPGRGNTVITGRAADDPAYDELVKVELIVAISGGFVPATGHQTHYQLTEKAKKLKT